MDVPDLYHFLLRAHYFGNNAARGVAKLLPSLSSPPLSSHCDLNSAVTLNVAIVCV